MVGGGFPQELRPLVAVRAVRSPRRCLYRCYSFDFVYAFSVFSHLSEESTKRGWGNSSAAPRAGGVLILTTFQREVLERVADFPPMAGAVLARRPLAGELRPGGLLPPGAAAGEQPALRFAFIPEQYVRERWTRRFDAVRVPRSGSGDRT